MLLEERSIYRQMLPQQQGKRPYSFVRIDIAVIFYYLKGLGHAILGNFSLDQVVIELIEITK